MIQKIESLVRTGEIKEARRLISAARPSELSRAELLALANLARRIGSAAMTVRLLNPRIKAARESQAQAAAEEWIEYAAALRNLGALQEAKDILRAHRAHPEALFHLALCHFATWRYDEAIPLLEEYDSSFEKPSYKQMVGRLNLFEALIAEGKKDAALELSLALAKETIVRDSSLLWRKFRELEAQCQIFVSADFARAVSILNDVGVTATEAPRDRLLREKWHAIASGLQGADADFQTIRKQASELHDWETVRDCDYYSALFHRDRDRLLEVFFKTPSTSYRRRISGVLTDIPETFDVGLEANASKVRLDLRSGQLIGQQVDGSSGLKAGQSLHRLLICLAQDGYRPARLLSLFPALFPGEYFDPNSSAPRVHQLLHRLRTWFADEELPVEIREFRETYRLQFQAPFALVIPREPLPLEGRELEFMRLKLLLKKPEFTTIEAAGLVGASKSTLKLLLKWAVEEKRIESVGWGPNRKYKLVA